MQGGREDIPLCGSMSSVGVTLRIGNVLSACALLSFCCLCQAAERSGGLSPSSDSAGDDWSYYLGNPASTHYSRLTDINTRNVNKLRVAWTYDTGEFLANESNPLIVHGSLFFVSPKGRLISLNGQSGRERWTYAPPGDERVSPLQWYRGVSYWTDGRQRRILFSVARTLYSIDADTGFPDTNFGRLGRLEVYPEAPQSISPGVVYKDLVIIGGAGSNVTAFDIRSGQTRWTFNTIPRPGERGFDSWPPDAWKRSLGAVPWAGMSLDEARGLLFVPTGDAYGTFYGADRPGENLFSDSLLALDANTGKLVWYFQTVRHDLWDRELPAPPTLVSVVRGGKRLEAVAQISKTGFVYVLDRLTGDSLFPLVETRTLSSLVPGETPASTQRQPELPAPFVRQHLTRGLLTRRTPQAAAAVKAEFKMLHSGGLWDPPSEQGTVVFPGIESAEWGGAAYDPETGVLYVNANEMPWVLKLKRRSTGVGSSGGALYRDNCSGCHGEDRFGHPPEFPSLVDIAKRLMGWDIATKIRTGGTRMPAFPSLNLDQITSLVEYLETGVDALPNEGAVQTNESPTREPAYVVERMSEFTDPEGYPAVAPPWGTLNAIDLSTGRYAWTIPFGEYPELTAIGLKGTGSQNYGGAIVTAGGLLFIGATSFDKKFHAYDKRTGKLLWETVLRAAGNATPATYRAGGRQFVVIAAGGGRPPKAERGSTLIAFALPD